MERVFFANTDSRGPVSSTDDGIDAAHRAVDDVKRLFAGRTSQQIVSACLPEPAVFSDVPATGRRDANQRVGSTTIAWPGQVGEPVWLTTSTSR